MTSPLLKRLQISIYSLIFVFSYCLHAEEVIDTLPEVIKQGKMIYPKKLKKQDISGNATLTFIIGEKGDIIEIENSEATHPEFARAAGDCLRRTTYTQTFIDNKPVKVRAIQTFRFTPPKKTKKAKLGVIAFFKLNSSCIKGVRVPTRDKTLVVPSNFKTTFKRGLITTTFNAHLPAGQYIPIADSDKGTYFLAPEGFNYNTGGYDINELGGLFVSHDKKESYVWTMEYVFVEKMRQKLISGTQIKKMGVNFLKFQNSPVIEGEFKIPDNAFSITEH